MKHRHHILPKHAGGTNDPSNIVYLTPSEHAEAHRLLFEKYGRWQDFVAWRGLSKQTTHVELRRERQRLSQLGRHKTQEERRLISENNGMRNKEVSSRVGLKLKGNKNSVGHPNGKANKGQIWITNGIVSKRIFPDQPMPRGFMRGRFI